jgi:glycosyltransferase involved in cell wall biosynthesis
MKPMISVIVPVYNVQEQVRSCLKSILAQTFSNFELITVDDGSTDNSSDIIHEVALEDNRVVVFRQENRGLSAARNSGLAKANGKYVVYVDGDDVIAPDFLAVLCRGLVETGADVSVVQAAQTAQPNSFLEEQVQAVDCEIINGAEAVRELMLGRRLTVSAWAKMAPLELWERHIFPRGRIYEDLATTPGLIGDAKRVSLNSARLYGQVIRAGSITRSSVADKHVIDLAWSLREACRSLKSSGVAGWFDDEFAFFRAMEFSRLLRIYRQVESPGRESQDCQNLALKSVRQGIPRILLSRSIPVTSKAKVFLAGYFPRVYDSFFYSLQDYKRRR